MLWLDTSWVLNLTYIFRPHSSLFIVIFSSLASSHHFFRHHISSLVIFIICLFSHHCLLDIILVSPWVVFFTRHCMEDRHILSSCSPHGQWFRDFNLRGCLISEDSCYIRMWRGFDHLGMYFHGSSFIVDQSMSKKKKRKKKKRIIPFIILHWACVWTCQFTSLSLCVRESLYESFFLRFYLCIFWVKVWVAHSIFVREVSDLSLVSLNPRSIHHPITSTN